MPSMDFFSTKYITFPQECKNVYIFTLDWKRFSSTAAAYTCKEHEADESYMHNAYMLV